MQLYPHILSHLFRIDAVLPCSHMFCGISGEAEVSVVFSRSSDWPCFI
jgi:hypothetical protein